VPIASSLFVWATLKNLVFSKAHSGGKILAQFGVTAVYLLVADIYYGFTKWSTNFAIPFLMVLATLLLTIVAMARRSLWSDYLGYLLATFFVSLCPLLLYLFGLASLFWPGIAAMLYSVLTIIGMFILSDRNFKDEMKKRFHF
jgi:hypothetical protein